MITPNVSKDKENHTLEKQLNNSTDLEVTEDI